MFSVAVWFALLGAPAPEVAQPRVVLVPELGAESYDKQDRFVERLSSDLVSVGFQVQIADERGAVGSLEEIARIHRAVAAVRTLASGAGVEVWLDERASGRPMVRHLVVDERSEGPDVGLVVMQTTELLRAGLVVQPELPPPESRPAVEVSSTVATPSEPNAAIRLSLFAGGGFFNQSGGMGTVSTAWLGSAVMTRSPFGAEVFAFLPLARASLTTHEGTTNGDPWLVGIGPRISFGRSRWFAQLGLGLGGIQWRLEGESLAPLTNKSGTFTSLVGYGRLAGGVRIFRSVSIGVAGFGAIPDLTAEVIHAERTVGELGRRISVGTVFVEISTQ